MSSSTFSANAHAAMAFLDHCSLGAYPFEELIGTRWAPFHRSAAIERGREIYPASQPSCNTQLSKYLSFSGKLNTTNSRSTQKLSCAGNGTQSRINCSLSIKLTFCELKPRMQKPAQAGFFLSKSREP